jgi:rubrerythrin
MKMDEQTESPKRVMLVCKRCGYRWFGKQRADKAGGKICPGCKSPYWNDEKKMHRFNKAKFRGDVPIPLDDEV